MTHPADVVEDYDNPLPFELLEEFVSDMLIILQSSNFLEILNNLIKKHEDCLIDSDLKNK